jgi:hypothetical protein
MFSSQTVLSFAGLVNIGIWNRLRMMLRLIPDGRIPERHRSKDLKNRIA